MPKFTHKFTVVPINRSRSSAEIIATDVNAILSIVHRLDCDEADVLKDDAYTFSVRHGDNGVWCIFRREDEEASELTAC